MVQGWEIKKMLVSEEKNTKRKEGEELKVRR